MDSSDRMNDTEEGGKPQTVSQVSRGAGSGEVGTSCDPGMLLVLWSPDRAGDTKLAPKLPDPDQRRIIKMNHYFKLSRNQPTEIVYDT